MAKLESKFQANLIKEIKERFPGCYVMKTDPDYIQGLPDLLILHKDRWAALECKRSEKASHRPNQDFHVDKMDDMSFASFIYPENKEEVLDELQLALQPSGKARVSRSQSKRMAQKD